MFIILFKSVKCVHFNVFNIKNIKTNEAWRKKLILDPSHWRVMWCNLKHQFKHISDLSYKCNRLIADGVLYM